MAELAIDQTVELNDGWTAAIRFMRQTDFAPGEWIEVKLEDHGRKSDENYRNRDQV